MTITFLDIFDQLRFMIGAITAEWIFICHVASPRKHFPRRLLIGGAGCLLYSASYFLLEYIFTYVLHAQTIAATLAIGIWWLGFSFVTILFIWYCFEITVCNAFFRGLMGLALQEIITVFLQYCVNRIWFPALSEKHTMIYICLTIVTYCVFEVLAYYLLARRMQDMGNTAVLDNRKNIIFCILVLFILSLCTDFTSGVFEWSMEYSSLATGKMEYLSRVVIPYYCVFVLITICIIILVYQYSTYEVLSQQQEKELLKRLEKEKAQQYELSRENIELINQKCHDLKYQLEALKLAEGKGKEKIIEDTGRAIQFYDAAVHTDNKILETILTEKSLLCSKYGIRFSCNAKTNRLDRIEVIDLYTMLGNALDNAIECVKTYENPEKRVISLSIVENGQMLHIFVDNYFEGELEIKDGYPVSGKTDKRYHGFGVKSINMLAKKYGGDSMIDIQNNTFSLHIMLPEN